MLVQPPTFWRARKNHHDGGLQTNDVKRMGRSTHIRPRNACMPSAERRLSLRDFVVASDPCVCVVRALRLSARVCRRSRSNGLIVRCALRARLLPMVLLSRMRMTACCTLFRRAARWSDDEHASTLRIIVAVYPRVGPHIRATTTKTSAANVGPDRMRLHGTPRAAAALRYSHAVHTATSCTHAPQRPQR